MKWQLLASNCSYSSFMSFLNLKLSDWLLEDLELTFTFAKERIDLWFSIFNIVCTSKSVSQSNYSISSDSSYLSLSRKPSTIYSTYYAVCWIVKVFYFITFGKIIT